MRWTYLLAGVICLACSGDTEAGLFGRCHARRQAASCQATRATTTTTTTLLTQTQVYETLASPQGGDFLGTLNGWRARNGRGPVGWDATLAAFAATNTGVHSPGSAAGGSQVWAPVSDPSQALAMWMSSPAHSAILLNATIVGFGQSPSGMTLNAR